MFMPPSPKGAVARLGADGLFMLAASMVVGVVTGGITFVWAIGAVVRGALALPVDAADARTIMIFGMRLDREEPGDDYRRRLDRGKALADAHPSARLVILGGYTGGGISEAEAGRRYLIERGVESTRIDLEERSTHSLENLREARAILADAGEGVVAVSNRYHLKRIATLAEGLAMSVTLVGAEDTMPWNPATLWRLALEGVYLHWYHTGRVISHLIGNRSMIDRIT